MSNKIDKVILGLSIDEARQLGACCVFRLNHDGKLDASTYTAISTMRDTLTRKIEEQITAATLAAMRDRCPSCDGD